MTLQEKDVRLVADALLEFHRLNTAIASSSDGYECEVQDVHPSAVLYFKRDQLGEDLVEFAFDGGRSIRVDYMPTAAGAAGLAKLVADRIAGVGGRGLTPPRAP
jgi:hypothetical protein